MTAGNGGQLNPDWVEELMGWPRGWSCLDPICVVEYTKWYMGFKEATDVTGETGAREVLQNVWQETGEEALQRAIRGLSGIPEKESLLVELCKHKKDTDKAWLQLACPETPEDEMRGLRIQEEIAGASHRPGYDEQQPGEYTDALQTLSRFLAHYGSKAWKSGSWENAVPRVVDNVASRVDRLKAIGNGQVPAVVAAVWRLLMEAI